VARIDVETVRTSGEERALERVLGQDVDLLVASPMLAKGPALPGLGLAAAVDLDALLALPDFRAAEWTYQYLTGLANRVAEGKTLVETSFADHYAVRAAAAGDYDGFYAREADERRLLSYPPFSHLARVVLVAGGEAAGRRLHAAAAGTGLDVLGPSALPGRPGARAAVLRSPDRDELRGACLRVKQEIPRVRVDLDPIRL